MKKDNNEKTYQICRNCNDWGFKVEGTKIFTCPVCNGKILPIAPKRDTTKKPG